MLGPFHADTFQNGDLKHFQVATILPYPRTLTAYPTPVLGSTPDFFHQNNRKGCKSDYLDARGHFVLHFGATRDKPKTRVKGMKLLTFSEWIPGKEIISYFWFSSQTSQTDDALGPQPNAPHVEALCVDMTMDYGCLCTC